MSGRGKLPLDDPRWLPIVDAHKRQYELTGEPQLAARELTEAMARERKGARSMRRSIYDADPDRELLPSSHWTKYQLWWRSEAKTLIVRSRDRSDPKGPDGDIGPSYSYAYYVWRPDLEKIWPPPSPPPTASEPDDAAPRRKPGPKAKGDWPDVLAAWLIQIARDESAKLENVDALVAEFREKKLCWRPKDTKPIRLKILTFLQFVRR